MLGPLLAATCTTPSTGLFMKLKPENHVAWRHGICWNSVPLETLQDAIVGESLSECSLWVCFLDVILKLKCFWQQEMEVCISKMWHCLWNCPFFTCCPKSLSCWEMDLAIYIKLSNTFLMCDLVLHVANAKIHTKIETERKGEKKHTNREQMWMESLEPKISEKPEFWYHVILPNVPKA